MNEITIRRPDDWHLHLRQGDMLGKVIGETARVFARAMVMPNTDPAIENGEDVKRYQAEIYYALERQNLVNGFKPLMTFKITPRTTLGNVRAAKKAGAIAGKLYPDGVTTGSEGGVRDFEALYPVFEEMQAQGLVLSIHGEHPDPDIFCLDREKQFFHEILVRILCSFPDLKIVMEHLSTAKAVKFINLHPSTNLAGTITLHHLELTLDDVVGGLLQPHNFCKPLAKRPEDRAALLAAVKMGNPKFFFGSDSAPHPISRKECACGCAGVYSAPVALPRLAEVFDKVGCLNRLEDFTSRFGAEFYGLPLNKETITLVKEPWIVEQTCPVLVPYLLGQEIAWSIA